MKMFAYSRMRCWVVVLVGLVTLTLARPRAERTPSSLRLQPQPQTQPQSQAYNSPNLPASKPLTQPQQQQPSTPPKSTFKIQIRPTTPSILTSTSSTKPHLHLQPIYLTPNGSTTPSKSLAALCHLSHSTRLYCGNFVTPISAPIGAPAALFSSVRGANGEGLERGVVSLGFEVVEGRVCWKGRMNGLEGKAGWVVKGDGRGSESVWAVFGEGVGVGVGGGRENVRVELRVDYEV